MGGAVPACALMCSGHVLDEVTRNGRRPARIPGLALDQLPSAPSSRPSSTLSLALPNHHPGTLPSHPISSRLASLDRDLSTIRTKLYILAQQVPSEPPANFAEESPTTRTRTLS